MKTESKEQEGQAPSFLADENFTRQRMAICKGCTSYQGRLLGVFPAGPWARCGECGCLLKLKTKLKQSTCPLGKW